MDTRVKRVPLVVVAVLVAMVLTAAALKWRAQRAMPTYARTITVSSRPGPPALPAPQPGDGSTDALEESAPHGTRMLHGQASHADQAVGRAPRTTPSLGWSTAVGGPVEAQVTASPDEQTLYVASLGGELSALARADGAVKWTLDLHERAYATPCVADDGTVYAGSDAKKLVAVSPEGRVRWSLETDGEADTGPVLAPDGTVVFAAGRMVYGVTPLGFVRWRFTAKRKVFTSPAVAPDGRVYFGSQDHRVYALTPQGGPAWNVDLGADVDGAPVIGPDGAVFVGTDGGEVVKLDGGDGHVLWRASLGGYVRGTLSATRAGSVLAGVYGPTPREVMLDAADGSVRLSFPVQGTGAREFGVHGGAVEDAAGALLFGAQDDDVYALDPGGDLLWSFRTGGDVDSPVTLLGDGSVVFGSDDGMVYLLRGS
jgi:outer membrane protein assembly factor BamB